MDVCSGIQALVCCDVMRNNLNYSSVRYQSERDKRGTVEMRYFDA
jgi:hypothetical protein